MRYKFGLRSVAVVFPVALVLVMIMVGCKSQPSQANSGLAPVHLQLDWYPQPEHGGFFTALLKGYYKAEGLDVTIVPLPQYSSLAQLVASGQAEIGLGSSDQILEWDSNGLPFVAVAATMQHDPQAVMVHNNSPVHDFKDLEGHTVAAKPGATWLKYVISRYNLHSIRETPSTQSIASFLSDPNYIQQIFITSEPFSAQQADAPIRTFLISSSGYDPYRVQFTTREFATQHPDVVARFVRASIHGWKDYLQDPGPTNAYLLKLNPALNPAQEAFSTQALKDGGFITGNDPGGPQIGRMTAARWQAGYEQLKSLGILHGPLDPTSAYSLKFNQ